MVYVPWGWGEYNTVVVNKDNVVYVRWGWGEYNRVVITMEYGYYGLCSLALAVAAFC